MRAHSCKLKLLYPTQTVLSRKCCLQAFAGIVTVSVGHCHSKVNEAIQNQMSKLQHTTTIYLNDQIALYGKEMAAKMPGNLKVCNQTK